MRNVIFLFVVLGLFETQARAGVAFEDIKFVDEKAVKHNKIELVGESPENLEFSVVYSECKPLEIVKLKSNGLNVYRPTEDKERIVRYVQRIGLRAPMQDVTLAINGIEIALGKRQLPEKSEYVQSVNFAFDENCTKLVPTTFSSAKDQRFRGVDIKKGNLIRYKPYSDREHESIRSFKFDKDGYPDLPLNEIRESRTIRSSKGKENTIKEYSEIIYGTSVSQCFEVSIKRGITNTSPEWYTEKGKSYPTKWYIYDGEAYQSKDVSSYLWLARSKYLGHRLCSSNPEAKAVCTPTIDIFTEHIYKVLFLDDETFKKEFGHYNFQLPIESYRAKAEEHGKKCDQAVAKYEKETGKKVKVSPYYPVEYLESLKQSK